MRNMKKDSLNNGDFHADTYYVNYIQFNIYDVSYIYLSSLFKYVCMKYKLDKKLRKLFIFD